MPVLSDTEQKLNIRELGDLFMQAYRRFEDTRLPEHREQAYVWLRTRNAAITARAEFEAGCYFHEQGAKDGLALRAGVAHG